MGIELTTYRVYSDTLVHLRLDWLLHDKLLNLLRLKAALTVLSIPEGVTFVSNFVFAN